jgi:hypothetical protein
VLERGEMEWVESISKIHIYTKDTGNSGYSIIPYKNKYLLQFFNSWRTDRPNGEYITIQATLSNIFIGKSPSYIPKDIMFDSVIMAKKIAQKHLLKDDEPRAPQDWF